MTTTHTTDIGYDRIGRYDPFAAPHKASVPRRINPADIENAIPAVPHQVDDNEPVDSLVAERLWGALYRARTDETVPSTADLEDAAFRFYLPMARSLAHSMHSRPVDRVRAEQAAELGLAYAVLAWRQRGSAGFRRFARSAVLQQIRAR